MPFNFYNVGGEMVLKLRQDMNRMATCVFLDPKVDI
jgi:hypothetical protein